MSSQPHPSPAAQGMDSHLSLSPSLKSPSDSTAISRSGVAKYYDANSTLEHARLVSGRVEFEISLRTIISSLQGEKLRIADIGGGTGRYAVELAKLGHQVTLIDISQSELDIAASHAAASNIQLDAIHCADASNLFETCPALSSQIGTFDAVLLMGPLYHLLEERERERAMGNAGRLLKVGTSGDEGGVEGEEKGGGVLFASFVTTFGHLRGVARKDPGRLGREGGFYGGYLGFGSGLGNRGGDGDRDGSMAGKYTRREEGVVSYHVHPSEIRGLFEKVEVAIPQGKIDGEGQRKGTGKRFKVEKLVACEGFLGADLAENLNGLEGEEWTAWMGALCRYVGDECVLGASEHLLAVVRLVNLDVDV
ncbi:S-adenosyl-L-methionine-dependent methyltransferase [Leptodontidium sp. 2 PMI_412]|nr:S-adenosyl-L-methionine-dependent methyltransferase [Leptodontidium sp. 2 PMI_412]